MLWLKHDTKQTQRSAKRLSVFNLKLSNNHHNVSSCRRVQFIKAYAESDNQFEQAGSATYVHSVDPEQANRHFP